MEFAEFLTHVLPSVSGCPDAVATDHVIKAARLFCERTHCWSYETDPMLTVTGQSIYPIDLDQDQERVRLIALTVDGQAAKVVDTTMGRSMARRQCSGSFAYLENALDMVVYPTPTADNLKIISQLTVKPILTAASWPDELAEYVTDIAHGAVATLCLLPRQEWSNPGLAATETAMFMDRVNAVAYSVSRGYSQSRRSAVRWF